MHENFQTINGVSPLLQLPTTLNLQRTLLNNSENSSSSPTLSTTSTMELSFLVGSQPYSIGNSYVDTELMHRGTVVPCRYQILTHNQDKQGHNKIWVHTSLANFKSTNTQIELKKSTTRSKIHINHCSK
jgi:hypothetical protein